MLIQGWTLEIYHERYQDLLAAYECFLSAVQSSNPAGQLDWSQYHLNRTTQGWPEEWRADFVHQRFHNAAVKLTGASNVC